MISDIERQRKSIEFAGHGRIARRVEKIGEKNRTSITI